MNENLDLLKQCNERMDLLIKRLSQLIPKGENIPTRQRKGEPRKKLFIIKGGLYTTAAPKGLDDGLTDVFRAWLQREGTNQP